MRDSLMLVLETDHSRKACFMESLTHGRAFDSPLCFKVCLFTCLSFHERASIAF